MTPTQMITLIALGIYFSMLGIMNWRGQRTQTAEGYAIGGRQVGYIATTGTLAAGVRDGSGIILWTSFAYSYGYGGMWAFVGMFLAFCLMGIIGPRVRRLSIKRDYVTVNQMLRDDIGVYTQKIITWVMLIICILIMSMQIYVAGNFFSSLLHQPYWIGMIGIAVIVGSYLFMGGYSAVIRTNTFQFFWIISLIFIPFLVPAAKEDITNYASVFSMEKIDRVALFIIGFCYPIAGGDAWQHIFSARSDRVIRVSFPLAGPIMIIMTLSLIFLGLGMKVVLPDAQPDRALFDFFQAELASPYILAYIAIVVMAITTSDLDSYTYLFTSTAIKNIAPPSIANDKDSYKRWARVVLISALIFTTLIALTISNIVQFLFQAVSLFYIMGPVFTFAAMGLIQKSTITDRLVTIVIAVSAATYVWLFASDLMSAHLILTIVPAAICLTGCVLISIAQKAGVLKRG